jgi:hypothetical protein
MLYQSDVYGHCRPTFLSIFEPAQGRRGRQRRLAPDESLERRIVPKAIVIDEILIAECQAKNPLSEHMQSCVLAFSGLSVVAHCLCHSFEQPLPAIGLPQQDAAPVARHRTSVEGDLDSFMLNAWKTDPRTVTNRHSAPREFFCLFSLDAFYVVGDGAQVFPYETGISPHFA